MCPVQNYPCGKSIYVEPGPLAELERLIQLRKQFLSRMEDNQSYNAGDWTKEIHTVDCSYVLHGTGPYRISADEENIISKAAKRKFQVLMEESILVIDEEIAECVEECKEEYGDVSLPVFTTTSEIALTVQDKKKRGIIKSKAKTASR